MVPTTDMKRRNYCAQDNPKPGIQALPLYLSTCTGGMVVLADEEYDQRAWCRLEQVMRNASIVVHRVGTDGCSNMRSSG